MGEDATMSEAKTASGVSLDIVKVSALLFVRVNFDVYQNSISFLVHVIYLTDTSFPPTLIPPKTHRFWKSLIVSKDYDTEIIDGTVSTARAGFEDCTKLRKISVTKRTWDQAEETKNKNKNMSTVLCPSFMNDYYYRLRFTKAWMSSVSVFLRIFRKP